MSAVEWVSVVVVGLAVLVAFVHWFVFGRSLPKVNGTLRVKGVSGTVEILRDRWGVPHIFAKSAEDASFGLGFCHAQDRMWQMELNRRVGSGRLSELLGERAIPADRFLRRVGLRRAAEKEAASLQGEVRDSVEAYARGVNAALATIALPLELTILGVKPEPWTATDSLVFSKVMGLSLCANWEGELVRGKVVQKVGVEKAAALDLFYPEGVPVVVPPGTESIAPSAAELQALYEEAKPYLSLGSTGSASNNWVVAGSRTASGSPILANDPHLKLTLPSVWYEAHMVAPGLDVYGATLASLPSIVLGHNRDVAWGFTNSFADVMDLYVEKLDPKNREQYEYQGAWHKAEIIRETIRVKGGADVVEEVMITRHGPIIAGVLALRWAAHDVGFTTRAAMGLQKAKSAADVREALRDWHTPSQNVVFADKDNIGYVMAGVVPIRAKGSGLVPVPGWTGEWEWTGWVPYEELPQAWNPPAGYIATANNKVVGKDYKHHISWDYMNGYRVGRIEQMLRERSRLTWEDCRDIQRDVFTQAGRDFARAVSPRLVPVSALETKAAALLAAFDGHATTDSTGASVYEAMVLAFVRRALEPLLGTGLTEEVMGKTDNPIQPFGTMVGRYTSWAVRMASERPEGILAAGQTWDAVTAGAFREAVETLARIAGPDPAAWHWGELHRMKLDHPLTSVAALAPIFRSPDMPIGGDTDSPLQTALVPHVNFRADAWAPSWRHIVDFADVKQSRSVFPGGQSGHPGSAHYLDQLPLWYRGEFRVHLLDRKDIEANLEGTLTLVPLVENRT